MTESKELILEVKGLRAYFNLDEGMLKAVDGVSFNLYQNRVLGVVGESGCGKSVTAQSVMRIVPAPGVISGEILLHRPDGSVTDLVKMGAESDEMNAIRGNEIAMVFQEPMTAFSPVHSIANQLTEMYYVHGRMDKAEARSRAIELLNDVGIPAAEKRIDDYTFQFSGGMRQRAMIAMAMMNKPRVLIADEPTTALDVTIQAQILRLMKRLQHEMGVAIMYITHNLGVIANMADDIAVMYKGKMVEFGSSWQVFKNPLHPYTQALMRSIPRFSGMRDRLMAIRGSVGVPIDPPDECPFGNRCDHFMAGRCEKGMPAEVEVEPGHRVSCHLFFPDDGGAA